MNGCAVFSLHLSQAEWAGKFKVRGHTSLFGCFCYSSLESASCTVHRRFGVTSESLDVWRIISNRGDALPASGCSKWSLCGGMRRPAQRVGISVMMFTPACAYWLLWMPPGCCPCVRNGAEFTGLRLPANPLILIGADGVSRCCCCTVGRLRGTTAA